MNSSSSSNRDFWWILLVMGLAFGVPSIAGTLVVLSLKEKKEAPCPCDMPYQYVVKNLSSSDTSALEVHSFTEPLPRTTDTIFTHPDTLVIQWDVKL